MLSNNGLEIVLCRMRESIIFATSSEIKIVFEKESFINAKEVLHFIQSLMNEKKVQPILKSDIVEQKKHLRALYIGHDEISNIIKSNYGRTFHKLCIINIVSALHKENKLQLRCKNSKLFRLIPRKKDCQISNSCVEPIY